MENSIKKIEISSTRLSGSSSLSSSHSSNRAHKSKFIAKSTENDALKELMFQTVHGLKRQRVLKSHSKYIYLVPNGTLDEFKNLIHHFIVNGKTKSYCRSVVITLVRILKMKNNQYKRPFGESFISKTYRQTKKILDNAINNEITYDSKGNAYKLDVSNVYGRRGQFEVKDCAHTHLNKNEAEHILKYAENIFNEYLKNINIKYSRKVEWAFLIYILANTGMRKGEAMSMTVKNLDDFITKGETILRTKTGNQTICVGSKVAQTMHTFLSRKEWQETGENQKIFQFSYDTLRLVNMWVYKELFKRDQPLGSLFHVWRSLFSERASALDSVLTQSTLNHRKASMTERYIKNQKLNDTSMKKEFLRKLEKTI